MKTPLFCSLLALFFACNRAPETMPLPNWPTAEKQPADWNPALTPEIFYDKVLGSLVGGAIGDAMGASTEGWHRDFIKTEWGYLDSMTEVVRGGEPEGPWEDNLPPGGTTDDTRWKYFFAKFLNGKRPGSDSLDAKLFARFILETYLQDMEAVKKTDPFDPEPLDRRLRKVAWLQEWAKVAKPYLDNSMDGYKNAVDKFYGGEITCAGMLYAPVIGAFYPSNPEKAYLEGYRLGIFDIGYGRDITGLTAALVSKAMQPGVDFGDITKICRRTDPLRLMNSRLLGRTAYRFYWDARTIAYTAKQITVIDPKAVAAFGQSSRDPLYLTQLAKAFSMLEEKQQDVMFHAGEIHQINLTALEFSGGDFKKAMEFVANYGRDNDTVASVTGSIMGAYLGFKKLPPDQAKRALETSRKVVGIDLEEMARWVCGMKK